jgi:hypothetical protein
MNWLALAAIVIGGAVNVYVAVSVKKVHVLVNSNMTEVLKRLGKEQDRTAQLTGTLKDANVKVPPAEPSSST